MAQKTTQKSNSVPSASSSEIELPKDIHAWLAHMESKFEMAHHKCIPRVPSILRERESNQKCFDPVAVSLGPYHHGKLHLQRMERYKFDALKRFTIDNDVATLYKQLEPVAVEAKEWYEKPIELCDEDFKKMIFMDSCFILNFIIENEAKQKSWLQFNKGIALTNNSTLVMNRHDEVLVLRDMMMLENQIPFIVLNKLMSFRYGSHRSDSNPFDSFLDNVIGIASPYAKNLFKLQNQVESVHLLDLLRKKILGPKKETRSTRLQYSDSWFFSASVTELKGAGIICRRGDKMQLKEISYKKSLPHSVLLLPPIVIDDFSKYLFLNMIAYETSPVGPPDSDIISYICFMNALISREEDVKDLITHKVIDNALGSDKEVVDFFNGLATDLISYSDPYSDVKRAIERHYNSPWVGLRVKFMVSLMELYQTTFKSPWTTIGFLAGVFLLLLAAIQTYFTVFPRSGGGKFD